jgi:hypothetical protein
MKGSEPIDSFCYGQAKEGIRYTTNNTSVQDIPTEELSVVKKIMLVRQGEKLCVSYNKTLFGCKVIPNSTTEKEKKLLSFQNNYLIEMQNYLKNNYSLLYYDSDLKELFNFYATTKKEIKAGSYALSRKGKKISLTDVASLRPIQYNQTAQDYLITKIVEKIPEPLLAYYYQEREKWYQSL